MPTIALKYLMSIRPKYAFLVWVYMYHGNAIEDKLKGMKVKIEDGKIVNAPILADCPVNIECTVVNSIMTGSHEMFIGKVEYVHADGNLVNEDGSIDFSQISFI